MFSAYPLLEFHSQALALHGKFEFHKGLKVSRCCLGSPSKSGEPHPHVVRARSGQSQIKG